MTIDMVSSICLESAPGPGGVGGGVNDAEAVLEGLAAQLVVTNRSDPLRNFVKFRLGGASVQECDCEDCQDRSHCCSPFESSFPPVGTCYCSMPRGRYIAPAESRSDQVMPCEQLMISAERVFLNQVLLARTSIGAFTLPVRSKLC